MVNEAEIVPLILDQVNACVGNVLPLIKKQNLSRKTLPFPLFPLPFPPPFFLGEILTPAAMGSGILFTYPQLATIAGVQGVVVYSLSSALPLLVFAFVGPIIRRKCPEGFVLTEWTRQRYGVVAAIWLSFMTLATLFLYMIAELSALGQVITALTGMDGLPTIIVEVAVTTIYTCRPLVVGENVSKKRTLRLTLLQPSAVSKSLS